MYALTLTQPWATLLQVLARMHPTRLSRTQLGTLAGFTVSGGTFGTYLGVLKRNGLIEESGGLLRATDALFLGEQRRAAQ